MSDSEKLDKLHLLFGLLLVVFVVWVVYWILVEVLVNDTTKGQFGDMFGGINALFSAFAFAGLIYTVLLQRKELTLQREELKATREELKAQRIQLEEGFSGGRKKKHHDHEALQDELYNQIGRLKVELDWLKKNLVCSLDQKRRMIDSDGDGLSPHRKISIERQCELIGLSRSSYYYQARGEDEYNLLLMRLIDEQYTRRPILGVRRMRYYLRRQGHWVNHKRVARLMRLMGLAAIYPKPKTSISSKEHQKYPYLLRDLAINRPDQVWCTDVTYIRLHAGFVYLTAIMDWYSRFGDRISPCWLGASPIRWTPASAWRRFTRR